MRCLVLMLLLLCASCQSGEAGDARRMPVLLEGGPGVRLEDGNWITSLNTGFVARLGHDYEILLSGDAIRWNTTKDSLWATGTVVCVLPAMRIHAARIGLHPERFRRVGDALKDGAPPTLDGDQILGDAWELEAWFGHGKQRFHIRAERLEMRSDRMAFHGVVADFGHGSTFSFHCPSLQVYLRPQARADKSEDQIARYIEGVAIKSPTIRAGGVPVLWLPYLYRDYLLDYPWSTFEAGNRMRLGTWFRYRVGSNLPEMAGWRTRLAGRFDHYNRAGSGYGLSSYWRHRQFGRGEATFFRMEHESVADPTDEHQEGGRRRAEAWDAEHYVSGRGWAAAARYTVLPDADPSKTLSNSRSPDERFRTDFLHDDLAEKPFARRGLAATWLLPWINFTADTDRLANIHLDETERLVGLEATVPQVNVLGPIDFSGHAWVEQLWRRQQQMRAQRVTWDSALSTIGWHGSLATDMRLGLRGVRWDRGQIGGGEIDRYRQQHMPLLEGGTSIRLTSDNDGLTMSLVPRLGVQLLGKANGDVNPGYDFLDGHDRLEQDQRYLTTGFDYSLHAAEGVFTLTTTARWALRDQDQSRRDDDGTFRTASTALSDLSWSATGVPHPDVELTSDATYDFRLLHWTAFDSRMRWQAFDRVGFFYNGTYVPATTLTTHSWLHRIGNEFRLNRYVIESWVALRPEIDGTPSGSNIALWHIGCSRQMVDGIVNFGFERATLPATGELDHRFTLRFVLGGDADDQRQGIRPEFGF